MEILLGKNKRFYKANLHCHSTKSDGKSTVEHIKEVYKKNGYSVVAFTDHDAIYSNSYLSDEDFLTLTSFELAVKEDSSLSTLVAQRMRCIHFNLFALDENNLITPCYSPIYNKYKNEWTSEVKYDGIYERKMTAECVNDIIRIAHEKGFLICLNHPSWSLLDATDYLEYEGLDMLEIVNYSCRLHGHSDDENVLDIMARHGKTPYCVAADDNHAGNNLGEHGSDSLGGWVMIDAPSLEYGEIMKSLKNGDFYASQGPEIYSITKDGNRVTVKCSDAVRVYLSTDSRCRKHALAPKGECINEATFELVGVFDKFRIVVEDKYGKRAYSQFYNVN